jgi:predicted RND superfamily exporter protein
VLIGHALGAIAVGRFWTTGRGSTLDVLTRVEGPSEALGRFVVRHSRTLELISALLFVVLGLIYWNVPAEHSIREHLPKNNAANAALGRFDREFGGAFPIQIVIPKTTLPATSLERLALIGRVHRAAASVDGAATPLSIWSLYEWLGGDDDPQAKGRLDAALAQMSPGTRSRFLGPGGEALVTVNVQEAPTHVLDARVAAIEAAVAAAAPTEKVAVTGVTVVLNREASRTIVSLDWSLATAVFGDIILMIIAFRNIPIGIVSCLANTLPLFATGALLYLSGRGMQFTSVIALTVAFGIAVDDTIHYINRFLVLRGREEPLDRRLIDTSREVGPVLVGTTIIILAGLSTTFASGLPTVTLFGVIAGITLVVAALGDLIVMPALIAGYARRWFEKKAADAVASENVA